LAKIRSVDLSSLINQFKDFSDVLGPEEIKILSDADILLSVTIPHDELRRLAYLLRSSQMQAKLTNLMSRLSYVFNMSVIDAYWENLIESKEVEGRDKRYIGLARDSKFRDIGETNAALETVKEHVNNVLWILKTIARSVKL